MARKSKEFLKRSRAAKKGWATRKRNQRKGARRTSPGARPRKGGKRRPPAPIMRDFIVSLDAKISRAGKKSYRIRRDIIVPAPDDSDFEDLQALALGNASKTLRPLIELWSEDNVTIAIGPKTKRRRIELR